jgi:hypothetical protein
MTLLAIRTGPIPYLAWFLIAPVIFTAPPLQAGPASQAMHSAPCLNSPEVAIANGECAAQFCRWGGWSDSDAGVVMDSKGRLYDTTFESGGRGVCTHCPSNTNMYCGTAFLLTPSPSGSGHYLSSIDLRMVLTAVCRRQQWLWMERTTSTE